MDNQERPLSPRERLEAEKAFIEVRLADLDSRMRFHLRAENIFEPGWRGWVNMENRSVLNDLNTRAKLFRERLVVVNDQLDKLDHGVTTDPFAGLPTIDEEKEW